MVVGNTQEKLGENWTCNNVDMLVDTHTHTHTHTQTHTDELIATLRFPAGGGVGVAYCLTVAPPGFCNRGGK